MTGRQAVIDVFLVLGVVLVLISCLGVVAFGEVHDRLHFSGPAVLGAVCITVAVLVKESFSLVGDKTILIAVFLLVVAPIATHAIGRAARGAKTRGLEDPGAGEDRGRGAIPMTALIAVLLTLVGVGGTVTVLIRDPARQAIAVGVLGLLLALLFFILQAPDVALSEIVIGSVALPAMFFLAIARVREEESPAERDESER